MTELSLRERKFAMTKIALMDAVLARLQAQALDDVAVKEVCNEVQVSETTFFNYFPSKQDVIIYYVQVWSIGVAWEMQQCLKAGGTHLDALRTMFDLTADMNTKYPGVMGEIVAYQARKRGGITFSSLTSAEYAYHFPDSPDVQNITARGIDQLLSEQLSAAHQSGEISVEIDLQALTMILISIFFVTPVRLAPGESIKATYRRQLDQLLP